MKKLSRNLAGILSKRLTSVAIILLNSSYYLFSQNAVISAGTILAGNKGIIATNYNIINNGTFVNVNDSVILNGIAQSVTGLFPVSFQNLTISAGSEISFNTFGQTVSKALLCDGLINTGGNLILLSDSINTALIDGRGTGNISGTLTMQRYLLSGFGYKYFSSPFKSSAVSEFADDINLATSFPSIYKYDESRLTSGWVSYVLPSNLLVPLNGYSVNCGSSSTPKTVDMTGIVNNGDISVTLYNHNNLYTKGFNLIGNPYPSPIDWDSPSGCTKVNIDNALYFFKASDNDQYGGTYSTYMDGLSSDGIASSIIPSLQGFFVHVSDGVWPVMGSVELNNNARIVNLKHSFIKSSGGDTKPIVRFVAGYRGDTLSYDPFVIYYDDNATFNFDGKLDALKLYNTDKNVTNFYGFSDDARKLSINAIPWPSDTVCTLRLGLRTEKDGEIIIKIRDMTGIFLERSISLYDSFTNDVQVLHPGNFYKVNLHHGEYQNRFFLNISNGVTTGITDLKLNQDILKVYPAHGILKADIIIPEGEEGLLSIINLLGQVLFMKHVYDSGHYEFQPLLKDGIYIISLACQNKRISKKLYFSRV